MNILLFFTFLTLTVSEKFYADVNDYPYIRARHPVIGVDDNNGPNEVLNFCGTEGGYEFSDMAHSCWYKPYVVSLVIPAACFLILCLFMCCSALIFSCTRCCCGPCCEARHGFCCPTDEKQYSKMEWLIFLIITLVLIIGIQLPFFIVALGGNSSMTAQLNKVVGSVLDIYPNTKQIVVDVHEVWKDMNISRVFTFMERLAGIDESDNYENPFKSAEEFVDKIDDTFVSIKDALDTTDTVFKYVELFLDFLVIAREVLFDFILIVPMIGGILLAVGGVLKIHQLSIAFFPCALIFSFISVFFIVFEYPATTVVSDVCVMYYDLIDGLELTSSTTIQSVDDLLNLTSLSTEELIDEVLKVLVDCPSSLIGNMQNIFDDMLNDVVDTILSAVDINMTAYDDLKKVCNGVMEAGMFYFYDGTNVTEYNYKYDRCTPTEHNNTRCVYDMMTVTEDVKKAPEPLLDCPHEEAKPPRNKFEELFQLLEVFTKIGFISTPTYWINATDLAFYDNDFNTDDLGNLPQEVLDIINEYFVLNTEEDPEQVKRANQLPFGQNPNDIQLYQILSVLEQNQKGYRRKEKEYKRKYLPLKEEVNENYGLKVAFCADMDQILHGTRQVVETEEGTDIRGTYIYDLKDTVTKTDKGEDVSHYLPTQISCAEPKVIPLDQCQKECPRVVAEALTGIDVIAQSVSVIKEMELIVNDIFDVSDSIFKLLGCDTITPIATGIKDNVCHQYLESEVAMNVGMIAYAVILWILYIFGLLAVKRFNKKNYEFVDESTRYYAEGEVELS